MASMDRMKKLTIWVNTGLLAFVAFMIWAFAYYGVTYMVYHSIPTVAAYLALYWFIRRDKLDVYVWAVYVLITAYMVAATICMGVSAGYLLYCMSLIPLSFYMEYLADQFHTRKMSALATSGVLVALFLGLSWYDFVKGPAYEVEPAFAFRCMVGNAIGVFCFLVGYTHLVNGMVRDSEGRLSELAHKDQLTGLYNRHYMMTYMDELHRDMPAGQWAAMADIDGFKDVNDTYGHHGGDYVLTELARLMREHCGGCAIARWGGEEFLFVTDGQLRDKAMLESLRRAIEETAFEFEGHRIPVSVTIGVADYEAGQSIDRWIQRADRKLYEGKSSGKNRVID